ncbi:hypothetical protein [Arthrobacter rhombi]|uniref:hypothetical protein n=1 Tax=Arthrobacter rhombi TaxID=71253 RepID=UPI003FD288F9
MSGHQFESGVELTQGLDRSDPIVGGLNSGVHISGWYPIRRDDRIREPRAQMTSSS